MTPRLQEFARQAYERGTADHTSPKEANGSTAFFDVHADRPLPERQARSFAYALTHEPAVIQPLARLAGQTYQSCPGAGCPELHGSTEHPGWEAFSVSGAARSRVVAQLPENELYARHFGDGAFPGHICWDFGRMLVLGAEGMVSLCRERAGATADPTAHQFYACVEIALQGLQAWVDGHVTALEQAALAEADAQRRRELEEMAAVCRRVPRQPATTFREAVQAFWLQHLAVMYENPFGGNGPGRLDYYLWPYLEADLAAGRATMEEARDLVTELFVLLHERIAPHDGWVEALPVGGRSPDGVALEDARHWTAGGCMEVSPQGCNCDLLFSFAHNVARTLEVVVNGGCLLQTGERASPHTRERANPHTRALTDYASFEDLYEALAMELERELRILLRRLDIWLGCYAEFRPSFLLLSMTHDCLERGRTIEDGGARYTDYGGSGVGIPNVGDSLYALRRAVFEEQRFAATEVVKAMLKTFIVQGGHIFQGNAMSVECLKEAQGDPEGTATSWCASPGTRPASRPCRRPPRTRSSSATGTGTKPAAGLGDEAHGGRQP